MAKPTEAPAPAASAPSVAPPVIGPLHSPHRRVTDLLQRLAPGKMRVGFFIGAGCPLAVADESGKKPLIPEIAGLTKIVKDDLAANPELKSAAETIWSRIVARGVALPTVEDVLSHIRTLISLSGTGGIDGFSTDDLKKVDAAICLKIKSVVGKSLATNDTPYHILASWIQAIARDKPVEIFTTNYDLLLEQALEAQRVAYFDGFVGSDNAFLDLESMAVDDLPARWARLWKLHGSINWWMTSKNKIRRSRDVIEGEQLLIYPSHLKYDQSRQMPYFAMLDRLRVFLRSDQCVLLTCGYSFADEHINAYIGQGLSGNPNASCIAMIWNDRADAPKAIELAKRHANLTVLAADGSVIGTINRSWDSTIKSNNPAFPIAICNSALAGRSKADADQCKWLLGDFDAFGQFLAHQLSTRDIEQDIPDAP
ncbi:SIR2 family protein [Tardiphaga sp. OK245]|uniref:SIR2 family NAD-dependent protein deacylase n=1 Tax=Tardiphaga sp. OK245 TaxID=1855306 RepID=UPI0008A7E90A|nr:SIR2 family protein [Tardiphaga sp. OK245]SEH40137.1 SIR2-like domain-containing protein [Tardiphaga sp. OK245]